MKEKNRYLHRKHERKKSLMYESVEHIPSLTKVPRTSLSIKNLKSRGKR